MKEGRGELYRNGLDWGRRKGDGIYVRFSS